MPVSRRTTRSTGIRSTAPQPGHPQSLLLVQPEPSPMSVSNRTTRSTQSSQKSFTEVIEIFSSDDDDSGRNHSGMSDQTGQLKQAVLSLTQKCSDLQTAEEEASAELKRAQKEIVELKLGLERVASARALLEDQVGCEVCMRLASTPYILGGCGHTFCLACLVNWFRTALFQYKVAHPEWKPAGDRLPHSSDARLRPHPYLAAIVYSRDSQPEYTCPKCRTPVLTRPMEDYSLKGIVQGVCNMMGMEAGGSQKEIEMRPGQNKYQRQKTASVEPFECFFGRAQT